MPIDLEWDALPPGVYDAVVHEVDFKFGSAIGIVIDYKVPQHGRDYHVSEWLRPFDFSRPAGFNTVTIDCETLVR
jgi:hypothetical protein